ncbi:MAG TPA: glycoside hydrolase domain-containing protein [Candidatus Acidoferrum sp.]|nr:glycoside hydrolase domain-containing protein [Candidatus Acidoferrum sp.]
MPTISINGHLRYIQRMRLLAVLLFAPPSLLLLAPFGPMSHGDSVRRPAQGIPSFLGFDLNQYPGDEALPLLRKTFSFSSYWLGPPPGEKGTTWRGKRARLKELGFGFVVLFSGRESRNLKNDTDARQKGALDAELATKAADEEGFPKGTIIFLDIEEGGRLPASSHAYIRSWTEILQRDGYRVGVYCSGMPVDEGGGVSLTTARDVQEHAGANKIVFWVYNDTCPPSPGCTFPSTGLLPEQSGFPLTEIWQYAQSPRRREFTARCPANYSADGNCYAPGDRTHQWFLDADVASSADPSFPK